ncbi:hypothetical protein [Thalassospira povalilytica]|uniref:hypothetical protein n=1 Tax=Thalassospira povalilytica TaxID=732237 RepID=UPI003AA99459
MFATVLAGVTVFVLGQFILKLVLEPIVSLKEQLGLLSAFCLRHQAMLTNTNATPQIRDELRSLTGLIVAKRRAVPFYKIVARILNLPNEREVSKACHLLNKIGYAIVPYKQKFGPIVHEIDGEIYDAFQVARDLDKVGELLKVNLRY